MRPLSIPPHIINIRNTALLGGHVEDANSLVRQLYIKLLKDQDGALPEVSIVIPAFNEEKNILRTILSIVSNNTTRSTEIIVVNNNSRDATARLVAEAGVPCILETVPGITATRNAGLKAARGKYVLNADADSIYPPDWIDEMVLPLAGDSQVCLTYGRFAFFPTGNTGRLAYFFYEYLADAIRWVNKTFREEAVNVYGFNSGFRRTQGLDVNGFDHPPGANEDGWLAVKLRDKGFGKLHCVNNMNALVWTSDRRIEMDGGLWKALLKRARRIFFPPKETVIRKDL